MSNFSFVEYSYNPDFEAEVVVHKRLNDLGFSNRSDHVTGDVSIWNQEQCIILLRKNYDFSIKGQVTGIGCVVEKDELVSMYDAVPDPSTDFFKLTVDNFNFYLVQEEIIKEIVKESWKVSNIKTVKPNGLVFFSGLEFNNASDAIKETLQILGFIKDGTVNSDRYVSKSKRFTVICRNSGQPGPHTLICDTQDVFGATASFTANNVELMKFNIEPEGFKDLTYKIKGYDCVAFGKYNSYSIENYIPGDTFNTNIIFRQRKQYLKIQENTLEFYETAGQTGT